MGTVVHAPTVWGSYYAFTRVRVGPEGVRWPQSAQRATRCGETDASSVACASNGNCELGGVGAPKIRMDPIVPAPRTGVQYCSSRHSCLAVSLTVE